MLDVAVSRTLSTEPENRYQSAAELRAALELALREPEASHSRRKLAVRGLASAVALAVIGVVGVGVARPEMRQRATAALSPMIEKVHALQARVAARAHGAKSVTAVEVAVIKPEPAAVTLAAAPEPGPVEAPAAVAENPAAPSDEGEVDDDASSASPSGGAETAQATPAAEAAEPSIDADAEQAVTEAHELVARGNTLKALNVLRSAAKKSPNDPKLLAALASAAEHDRAWGEAVRVARKLVAADPSVESKLELARLERKTGHRPRALEIVRSLVKDNPDSAEAQAMLALLGGSARVAMEK